MTGDIDRRACEEAHFIVTTGATVRACAAHFGVSKTTVHKDMRQRLRHLAPGLADEVDVVLARNLRERHIRGGRATKEKYSRMRH